MDFHCWISSFQVSAARSYSTPACRAFSMYPSTSKASSQASGYCSNVTFEMSFLGKTYPRASIHLSQYSFQTFFRCRSSLSTGRGRFIMDFLSMLVLGLRAVCVFCVLPASPAAAAELKRVCSGSASVLKVPTLGPSQRKAGRRSTVTHFSTNLSADRMFAMSYNRRAFVLRMLESMPGTWSASSDCAASSTVTCISPYTMSSCTKRCDKMPSDLSRLFSVRPLVGASSRLAFFALAE
mmetsp:Transcript_20609/g.50469  ORF Transcript_20609/g.50469 Transcript_20609/m.50469 type:complete len:238 (+) Transcript_20609:1134-1847(+)